VTSSAKPILLVCNTRTGSTALGTALALSNPDLAFYGEAFNPSGIELRTSFPYWLRDKNVSARRLIADKFNLCRDYLSARIAGRGKKIVLLGVKYHDLLNFMPVPALFDFVPELFAATRALDGGIVHLVRGNTFDSAISALVAQRRRVFHVQVGSNLPSMDETFDISPSAISQQVRMRVVQEIVARKQIHVSNCRSTEIKYEDIFGEHPSQSIADLARVFGIPLKMDKVAHQKIGRHYPSIVSNFKELADVSRSWQYDNWPVRNI